MQEPLIEDGIDNKGRKTTRIRFEYYQCKRCEHRFRKRPRSQQRTVWLLLKCPKCGSSVRLHTGKHKKIYHLPGLYGRV